MAEQNEWKSLEALLESPLLVPPGAGAYYWRLQNPVEPFGATGQRRKVAENICINPIDREISRDQGLKGMLFQDPH